MFSTHCFPSDCLSLSFQTLRLTSDWTSRFTCGSKLDTRPMLNCIISLMWLGTKLMTHGTKWGTTKTSTMPPYVYNFRIFMIDGHKLLFRLFNTCSRSLRYDRAKSDQIECDVYNLLSNTRTYAVRTTKMLRISAIVFNSSLGSKLRVSSLKRIKE